MAQYLRGSSDRCFREPLIRVDGDEVFSADVDDGGSDYSVEATVRVGSLVDFLIGPNPSVGVIELTGTIRTAQVLRR